MTTEEKVDLLLNRVEGILKLLAVQTVHGKKTGEAVVLLDRAGLDRDIIAEILNTSQGSVRKFISLSKPSKNSMKEEQESGSPAE